jgi:hypothetical protein
MAVDRYTKLVLTVIAVCLVCLVWLSAGGPSLITPVSAQTNQRVLVAGWVDESGAVFSFPKAPPRLDCTAEARAQTPDRDCQRSLRSAWSLPVHQDE